MIQIFILVCREFYYNIILYSTILDYREF